MSEGPAPITRARKIVGFIAGIASGALFAAGLYLAAQQLHPDSGLILLSVLLIPFAASALAVLVAGIHGPSTTGAAIAMLLWVVGALLVGSGVFFREGLICIAMASPIFVPFGIAGALVARALRGAFRSRTPPAMVALLPVLLLAIEEPRAYPTMQEAVVTEIVIEAPIETVWREAIEIRDIADAEQSWTVTQSLLQIPRPVDARLIERDGGLVRAATWRGDVRFFEVVTEWRENEAVAWAFDIPEAAADRMLDHHLRLDQDYLRLEGGQYTLEAISPTRTRLTLTTSYKARTPFNAYASAWGDLLLGDIHRNVLNIVRERAEARSA